MEIEVDSQEFTSVITPFGLFKWLRMPMGLCNAPGAFQNLMETVLSGLNYEICMVYLDDIIVYGRTFDEYLKNLCLVFEKLKEANLKLTPKKCTFFHRELRFLGFVVSDKGIAIDPEKIEAVKKYPQPKNLKELRGFLGLTGFYRKHIKDYGTLADPMYKALQKDTKFVWAESLQSSFTALTTALCQAPILGYPNFSEPFTLCTDASLVGIGAVLSQGKAPQDRVIAYSSKTFSKGQRNYSATKRELFAVVYYTEYFKNYLGGSHFTVVTDRRALKWLYSFKESDGLVARWIEKLSKFDFTIEHRAGKLIGHADALSRIETSEPVSKSVNFVASELPHILQ